jgi:hypothetical protein
MEREFACIPQSIDDKYDRSLEFLGRVPDDFAIIEPDLV